MAIQPYSADTSMAVAFVDCSAGSERRAGASSRRSIAPDATVVHTSSPAVITATRNAVAPSSCASSRINCSVTTRSSSIEIGRRMLKSLMLTTDVPSTRVAAARTISITAGDGRSIEPKIR